MSHDSSTPPRQDYKKKKSIKQEKEIKIIDKVVGNITKKIENLENHKDDIKEIIDVGLSPYLDVDHSVHAEMHAMITASQSTGTLVRGGTLYTTVFPCSNCARHIIASGIKEIYYIEPYPKSGALKLHEDDLSEEESETQKVVIKAFEGASSNRFNAMFRYRKDRDKPRKNKNGDYEPTSLEKAPPKQPISLKSILELEALVAEAVDDKKLNKEDKES